MTLEQINIYTNISKISLSMADSVMMFTRHVIMFTMLSIQNRHYFLKHDTFSMK